MQVASIQDNETLRILNRYECIFDEDKAFELWFGFFGWFGYADWLADCDDSNTQLYIALCVTDSSKDMFNAPVE